MERKAIWEEKRENSFQMPCGFFVLQIIHPIDWLVSQTIFGQRSLVDMYSERARERNYFQAESPHFEALKVAEFFVPGTSHSHHTLRRAVAGSFSF